MKHYREIKPLQTPEQQAVPSQGVHCINALALRFGLADLGLRPQPQNGPRTVEQEYQLYITGDLFEHGLDPLRFWEVHFFNVQFTCTLADSSLPEEEDGVPNHIPDGDGLSTDSGLCCPL
jgi:hypothetical protein